MELFRLREGPWKELFNGSFQEYDIGIYSNPESVLMVLIFEKEKEKISGAVIELYKVFFVEGDSEQFVSTLPREVIMLYRHAENLNQKFLLLASKPEYVEWKEEKVQVEIDDQLKKLGISSKAITDVAKAYDLNLRKLNEAPKDARDAFFSQPLLVPITATAKHGGAQTAITETQSGEKEALLGLTKEGSPATEPIRLISTSIISGGNEKERKKLLHILCEEAMLANISVILFDLKQEFLGLGKASHKEEELKAAKVQVQPMGFPVKKMSPGKEVFIDFLSMNGNELNDLMGAGSNKSTQLITEAFASKNFSNLREAIDSFKKRSATKEFSEFEINRAKRILSLVLMHYSAIAGKNNFEELTKSWNPGIGKTSLLDLSQQEENTIQLTAYSIARQLLDSFREEGKTKKKKVILAFTSAEKMVPKDEKSKLQQELASMLSELADYGCGYFLETATQSDIDLNISEQSEAKLSIITGRDIGVQLKNRKGYRIILRPGLSQEN